MEPLQGKTGMVCYIEIPVYGHGILVTRMDDEVEVHGHLGVTLHVGSAITARRCQETITVQVTQEGCFHHHSPEGTSYGG